MIKVSENAKSRISQLMAEEGFAVASDFVRVGVKSGGCSGLSYELTFDKEPVSYTHLTLPTIYSV